MAMPSMEAMEISTPAREEAPTARILSRHQPSDGETASSTASCWACLPFIQPRRAPAYAVSRGAKCWVEGDSVTHCPICEVEFGTQHKHVTRRHCRKCGGVFCYTCTYDKAALREERAWPELGWGGKPPKSVHVCTNCYDSCPPPADGLRRCRFCHQRVRLAYFEAHHSVCLEEQYSRAQFAPQQLQHFGGCSGGTGHGFHSSFTPAGSSSSAAQQGKTASVVAPGPDLADSMTEGAPSSSSAVLADATPAALASASGSPATDPEPHPSSDASRKKPLHPFAVAQAAVCERSIAESLLCNVCMSAEANTAIIPCGHTVACVRCLERLDNCPVCRKPIERLLRIYRS